MSVHLPPIEHLEPRRLLAAGAIDPSYAPAFDNAPVADSFSQVVTMQSDGRSIHYAQLKKKNTLWREKPDGSLDKTFGSRGKVVLSDLVQDLAVAPDGKIVVLYYHFAPRHIHLARFNASGKPDRSFGHRGDIKLRVYDKFYSPHLTVEPDEKIVVGGNPGNSNSTVAVYRINSNGTLDKSFGKRGESIVRSQGDGFISDIEIRRTDKRIVALGENHGFGDLAVWIFAPNGNLEWTGSLPKLDPLMFASHADSLAIAGDGSIVVSGDYITRASSDPNDHDTIAHDIVARFPGPNSTKPFFDTELPTSALALQPDGKVIAAGANQVWRLNYDLTSDQSFGTSGKSDVDFYPHSLAIASDGKILVDGASGVQEDTLRQVRLSGDN